jgi:hypothetical protein
MVELEWLVDDTVHVWDDFIIFGVGPVAGKDGLERRDGSRGLRCDVGICGFEERCAIALGLRLCRGD